MASPGTQKRFRDQTASSIVLAWLVMLWSEKTSPAPAASLQNESSSSIPSLKELPPAMIAAIGSILIVAVGIFIASIIILINLLGSIGGDQSYSQTASLETSNEVVAPSGPLLVPPGIELAAIRSIGGGILQFPQEAVRMPNGLLAVADTGNHRIALFDTKDALVQTITTSPSGPLLAPFSLAVTAQGHLLVLDSDTGRITEYDESGIGIRQSPTTLNLVHARSIAVDALGTILVANPATNTVYTLTSNFVLQHVQQPTNQKDLSFDQPDSVGISPNGTIFVRDSQHNRIHQFSREWQLQFMYPFVPSDTQHAPRILALADGRILASDPGDNKLLFFSPASTTPQAFSLTDPTTAQACSPLGIAADQLPTILITCNATGHVLQVKIPGL